MISIYESKKFNEKEKNGSNSLENLRVKTFLSRQFITNSNQQTSCDSVEKIESLKPSRKRTKIIDAALSQNHHASMVTSIASRPGSTPLEATQLRSLANHLTEESDRGPIDSISLKTRPPIPQIFYENLFVSLFG